MTDAVDYPRGVVNRGTNSKGTPSSAGNPGTYVGTQTIDGVTYARYRAERGTWVSSSLKELGYDRTHGKDTAYGAYAGIVRTPEGQVLAAPDTIRPGQEYLIPISSGEQASRVSTDSGPQSLPPRAEQPGALNLGGNQPVSAGTRAPPEALSRQRIVGARATQTDPIPPPAKIASRTKASEDEEWIDDVVTHVLKRLIADGISATNAGREVEQDHLDKARGRIGLVSDWLNDVQPPYTGAWTNAGNFFVRASKAIASDNLPDAMTDVAVGYAQLTETQRAWNDYVESSILGAGKTIKQLESTRDTAFAVEVALATGGAAVPELGAYGAAVFGGTTGIVVLSESDSPAGEAVRGTLDEVKRAGVMANLRAVRDGASGMAYGIGESLSQIPESLVELPKVARKLVLQAGDILVTLFTDPAKLEQDLARFSQAASLLYQALNNRWDWLKSLPPDRQSFEIGRLSGHIEAMLIVLQAGPAAGAAAGEATEVVTTISTGTSTAAFELLSLQTQLVELGTAAGQFTAVAMVAAGPGGGGGSPGPARKPAAKREAGEIISYGDKARTPKLERHEVLQNFWLRINDIIEKRKQGIGSLENPTLLLPPNIHRVVSRYQRALGLFDRTKMASLNYKQVLALNALALKQAGIPQSLIRKIMEEALEHAIFSLARVK